MFKLKLNFKLIKLVSSYFNVLFKKKMVKMEESFGLSCIKNIIQIKKLDPFELYRTGVRKLFSKSWNHLSIFVLRFQKLIFLPKLKLSF